MDSEQDDIQLLLSTKVGIEMYKRLDELFRNTYDTAVRILDNRGEKAVSDYVSANVPDKLRNEFDLYSLMRESEKKGAELTFGKTLRKISSGPQKSIIPALSH